jgi:hypothetical protein
MYDVIFMGDVLEHFNEPLEMLQMAQAMIKPAGIVAVEVPSMFNSITGRLALAGLNILGKTKKMLMPPYHVNEFTPRTLVLMLKTAGFDIVRIVERIKSPQSITLRGSIFEKTTKKLLQYPNYIITRTVGVLGDRLPWNWNEALTRFTAEVSPFGRFEILNRAQKHVGRFSVVG